MSKSSHSFSVDIAAQEGLIEAILLQHIYFLQTSFVEKDQSASDVWVKRSVKAYQITYPYLTPKQISGAFSRMEERDLIRSKIDNKVSYDRTKSVQVTKKGWAYFEENAFAKRENGNSEKENGFEQKENADGQKGNSVIGNCSSFVDSILDSDNTIQSKADKPQPTPKNDFSENEIQGEPSLNENPKKPNSFTGGAAKKEKTAPKIHAENEPHFSYFSDPAKAKAAWTEWIEYKYSQHREKYKEAKTELAKLRQLFQQFNGDSTKFEAAINYSIGNLYRGIFAPKIENGNGKFQHLDKAQQQHVKLARFVADIHSGAAFANTGTVDIITGE